MSRVQTPGAPKRRRGAPKGNRNAVGNSGGAPKGNRNAVGNSGGAPKGNRNAFKHGGYAAVHWNTLTDEERALIADVAPDCETLLREEIFLLSIRERRMMERINAYEESPDGLLTAATIRDEEKREFDNPDDERGGQADAELPGHAYTLTTRTEAALNAKLRVEESLTRCQVLKHRCVQSLIKLRQTKSDGGEVDEAIRLEVESMIAGMA